jgi:hypothetical protein
MSANDHAFTGKVAFVTGAASGIGRATALAFARTGAGVSLVDLSSEGLKETARLIKEEGGEALALTCDVTDEAEVKSALDDTRPGIRPPRCRLQQRRASRSDVSAHRRRSPPPCSGSARTPPPSPPATPWSSTAAASPPASRSRSARCRSFRADHRCTDSSPHLTAAPWIEPKECRSAVGVLWDFSGTSGLINRHERETTEREPVQVSDAHTPSVPGHGAVWSLPGHLTGGPSPGCRPSSRLDNSS